MSTTTSAQNTMQFTPLGNVARFIRGITFKPEDKVEPGTKHSAVCMRTKNVQFDLDESDLIAVPLDFVKRDEQYLRETDILVSTANSWELVGKCSWVPHLAYDATAGGFISILRADENAVHPRFLYYWFSSGRTQHSVRHCGRQTTNISNMSYDRCLALEIPLPPLSEQQRISDILDRADAIRRQRQEAIDQLASIPGSAFQDMFGSPSHNKKGWDVGTIRDLVSEVKYGTSSKAGTTGEFPILRMNNVTYEGTWNLSDLKYIDVPEKDRSKYLVEKGDILFNRTNSKELVGKTAVFQEDTPMAFAGYLVRARTTKDAHPDYISGYLNSPHGKTTLRHMCKSIVGMANINAQEFQDIKIAKPPIEAQLEYVRVLDGIRASEKPLQIALAEADNLFNSLVQRAFKGEL